MSIEATIIVPTHNHGATLVRSVREGCAVPDGSRRRSRDSRRRSDRGDRCGRDGAARSDPRVRFWANPKHESRGEPHRDRAVRESRANVICYLSDDDLYLPDHVETVIGLLCEAYFRARCARAY